jgi:mannan endo-1,4-beta-mannosidase
MSEARPIRTRVVSPVDSEKITEEEFRKNLENQGYSEDEINDAVQEFLDEGGEFLVIDLRQYPDKWTALRNVGISVAQYAFADVPYWKINLNPYFGLANPDTEDVAPSITEVRADSWTIAPAGLSAGDLENYGTQSKLALDAALNQTSGGQNGAFDSTFVAFKVSTTVPTSISSFGARLKVVFDVGQTQLLNASSARIKAHLYADNSGTPGQRLITGGTVEYGLLETTYAELIFALPYDLSANTTYWIVLEQTAPPIGGEIFFDYLTNAALNIAKPDTTTIWATTAGKAWIKFYQVSAEAYATFNRDTANVLKFLPPPNRTREALPVYRVEGYWSYTCKALDKPQQMALYPRAFNDGSQWRYARFANDIHICVRYRSDGELRTQFYKFAASPSWKEQWWKKTIDNYNVIDTSVTPNSDQIINFLDYTSKVVDGQTDYINGRFEGHFTPIYNEAYTLRVTSNSGVRAYVNGTLVIDQWLNGSLGTFSYSMGTLANNIEIHLVIEYFHSTGTQRLNVQWQSTSQALANLSPSSSLDPAPVPLLLDTDKIQEISYVSVGKQLSDIDTPTHGAPPGDRIVIRSV